MKHIRTISMLVLSSMLITSLAGCSSNKQSMEEIIATAESAVATPTPVPGNPEQAIITSGDLVFKKYTDNYYLVGEETTASVWLKYNYLPNDVNIAVEEWSSSDESVATVSDSGQVKPVGFGECEITLHVSDGLTDGTTTSIKVVVEEGIIELDDQEIPDYDSLLTACKNAYGTFDVYDDSFSNAYESDEDTPHISVDDNTSSFYRDYSTLDKILNGTMGECVVCRCGDNIVYFDGYQYAFLCDDYLLFNFGYDNFSDPMISYDELKEFHDNTGLPIPSEEDCSILY